MRTHRFDTAPRAGAARPGGTTGERPQRYQAGLLVGQKYRLERRLGAGAMGEVWLARHQDLNTLVAVKFVDADPESDASERMLERFRFEAQVTAQLGARSRNIVAVHDYGLHKGVPYLAMEYVPGRSLDALIDACGPLDVEPVADVLDQVAEALALAHGLGIWHRDVKPANVLVIEQDGALIAKVADFGVAKALEQKLEVDRPKTTALGILVGSPAYMSPEQIDGRPVDARADLWSLGVVAYEALTGTDAFPATTETELFASICLRPHPPPSLRVAGLPRALDAWFERALAKYPEARFASAKEMAAAFRAAIARPLGPRFRARRAVVPAAVAVGLAGLAAVLLARPKPAAVLPAELGIVVRARIEVAAARATDPPAPAPSVADAAPSGPPALPRLPPAASPPAAPRADGPPASVPPPVASPSKTFNRSDEQ
jgi:serine/threonine-protein kinase